MDFSSSPKFEAEKTPNNSSASPKLVPMEPPRRRAEVLQLQQVAKSSDGAVANSVWLYYVAPGTEFMGIQEGQFFIGEPLEYH